MLKKRTGPLPPKKRKELSKVLFNLLPKDGTTITNKVAFQNLREYAGKHLGLDVSKEMYFDIRNELIDADEVGKGIRLRRKGVSH